jgi:UDP-glucose 6-dehydrogenase
VVSAFDPQVKNLAEEFDAVRVGTDAYDAAERVDALVLATEWPEFRELEPQVLQRVMKGDLVLDGRNFLDELDFAAAGLRVEGIGW